MDLESLQSPAEIIPLLKGGLVVSCQARGENPLSGPQYMLAMARAAQMGGAVGIRAEGPDDVRTISRSVSLPMIGLYKVTYPGSPVYITPTWREVDDCIRAGAHIIAIDATNRTRPGGKGLSSVAELVAAVHDAQRLAMADIATLEEALAAEQMGFDIVSTTLSGYTPYSPQSKEPDIKLVEEAAARCRVPVIAEGRYWTPEAASKALQAGAHAVVVGTAITNPWLTTKHFVSMMSETRS